MLSGGVAQVVKRLDDMYGMKRVGERVGEHLGYVGIALEQDYVGGLHKLLGSRRFTACQSSGRAERKGFAVLLRCDR